MRGLICASLLLHSGLLLAGEHLPPPLEPATHFAANEEHAADKLIIAAEPYQSHARQALFRVDYVAHGILPIRLIVTNNSDHAISLRSARILFETAKSELINNADPEDVERHTVRKEREGSSIPMPTPLPSIKLKGKVTNKIVEADFATFEFATPVVEAHTTRAGFLFYDLSDFDNPLPGSHLLIKQILDAEGEEMLDFEIPFNKFLESKSGKMD